MKPEVKEPETWEDIIKNSIALPSTFKEAKAAHEAILRKFQQKRKELADLERDEQTYRQHRHYECYKELREATENCGPNDQTATVSIDVLEEAWGTLGE